MTASEKARQWLADDIDAETRSDIESLLSGSEKALEDAFYKDLEFGTGECAVLWAADQTA